jgi:hypothetical protein
MATVPESTTSSDNPKVPPGVNNASNAPIQKEGPVATGGVGQEASKIVALEIEEPDAGDTEYPTGIKFAIIMMATGLCLVLVGLVCSGWVLRILNFVLKSCLLVRISVFYQQQFLPSLRISKPLWI